MATLARTSQQCVAITSSPFIIQRVYQDSYLFRILLEFQFSNFEKVFLHKYTIESMEINTSSM